MLNKFCSKLDADGKLREEREEAAFTKALEKESARTEASRVCVRRHIAAI